MHAFDHAYWPPHVATAWIITRDRNFVDRLRLDQSMRSVSIAYAIASNGCKPTSYKGSHDAWLKLQNAMISGEVEAIGDPYIRRAGSSGRPRELCEPTRAIDPVEAASAVLRDDCGSPDCLVSREARGRSFEMIQLRPQWCFRNVQLSQSDVLTQFPAHRATRATARQEAEAVKVLSGYLTDHTKRSDAEVRLREVGFHIGKRAFQQRVWPKAREAAGLPPVAPPGRKRQA